MAKKTTSKTVKSKGIIALFKSHLEDNDLHDYELDHIVLKPKNDVAPTCPDGTKPTLVRQGGKLVLKCI